MSSALLIRLASVVRSIKAHLSVIFYSFALHEGAYELHKYTREQKEEARGEWNGFDGELVNFHEPTLSSLSKLVRLHL